MVSYFTSLFNYFFAKPTEDDDDDSKEEFLAEQLVDLEIISEQTRNDVGKLPTSDIPKSALCFQRTGIITYTDDNGSLIDGMIYFDLSACSISLKLNDKITYLGYENENGSIVIVRILENFGTNWGDEEYVEQNEFEVIDHVIIGEVDYRQDRYVYIKDSDLKFSLDEVEAAFVPIKGDWLELNCSIQFDETKPTDISAEQVLQVKAFKPVRMKIKSAVVTEYSGDYGICDRQIYFSKDAIQNGSEPQIGAKVLIEAIESNQGMHSWRAIKMIVTSIPSVESQNISNINNMEENRSIEKEQNIEVTYPVKFDKVDIDETVSVTLSITNNADRVHVINKWIVLSKKRDSQISISPIFAQPRKLYPKQVFHLNITCQPKFLGNAKENFIILFRGFQIERAVEINVVDKSSGSNHNIAAHHLCKTEHEKIENMKKIWGRKGSGQFIPGVKIVRPPSYVPVKLGLYPVPDKIWSAILGDSEQTIYSSDFNKIVSRIETSLPCLCKDLNMSNYNDRWHTLMFMEEIQANINLRSYDMEKVFLIRCQEYLGVEVNGLSERRPSIIKGDRVLVKDIWEPNAPTYEGIVHSLNGNIVLMKFSPQFHGSYSGSDVSIEFQLSRGVFRKCHQAINLAISNLGPGILFPSRITTRSHQLPPEMLDNIQWYNKKLNEGQKTAITNILLGECRPLPYCIYGPPGTGKTVTVVETILQILALLPGSRILVATPSNSAANLITERLIEHRKQFSNSIIRLIAHYLIDSENIPDVIKPFCVTLDTAIDRTGKSQQGAMNKTTLNRQKSFIGRHRVTIGTCNCLGSLAMMGFPRGHFTHVIVDEAGQALEPEIMIPLTFTDKENGQIILAGDPMQLGPVVFSKYCLEFGLDESYLCRILETFPYQKDYAAFANGFNKKVVTRLNDNYRSLPEVLTLPSQMFYDASLVTNLNRNTPWVEKIVNVMSEIFDSNDKSGGIFVYGIKGINARAEDSPSWYNPQEASMLALTTCKLYKKGIVADEIGVIAPYIAQIKYLRILFDAMGLPQPKIGTVEEFQGQERPVILISTVRSSESHLSYDEKHTLGFVKNPKRLNVALTRAQVAVILFCDPHLLSKDPLWHKVVNHAVESDKYMGCDLPLTICKNNNIKIN